MLSPIRTPLVRLSNLFPSQTVYAKCEFLAPGGSFKFHGIRHLLEHLSRTSGTRQLVVPSMGNTAIAAAVGARAYGFTMTGVVPQTISRAKDERLQALGAELIKIAGGGSELLNQAKRVAGERGAYFVHPHLDPLWTDGYQDIAAQLLEELPNCRTLVFPVGGGGLLMGLTEYCVRRAVPTLGLLGCEAYNFPKYARYQHARTATIAEGLLLDTPHARVQERIQEVGITFRLLSEEAIRSAMRDLFYQQGLAVEPSSAITLACVQAHAPQCAEPIAVVLTGENITREDFYRLIAL
jgi:threonine dehydratase